MENSNVVEMKKNFIVLFYDICINVNDMIFKKEDNDEELSFLDHYIFQATSYALSIIHDDLFIENTDISLSKIFIYRSLIECLAIIKMYKNGDIPDESTCLINLYNYIIEYNYSKFKGKLDDWLFNFDELKENFKSAKLKYKEYCQNLSRKEFEKLLKGKLPFLFQKYSFDELIKMYLPDNLLTFYHIFSVYIHPYDIYITRPAIKEENKIIDALQFTLFSELLDVLKDYKFECKKDITSSVEITKRSLSIEYLKFFQKQKEILFDLSKYLKEHHKSESTLSNLYEEMGVSIYSIAMDIVLGFTEIAKCKIKPLFEHLALENEMASHLSDSKYIYKLFTKHTVVKLHEAYEIEYDKVLNDAYDIYINNVEKIEFDNFKELFLKDVFFMFESESINSIVKKHIEKITEDEKTRNGILLIYEECQMLSHANGYMLKSNYGAFMDYTSAVDSIDIMIFNSIKRYSILCNLCDLIDQSDKYKETTDFFERKADEYLSIAKEKHAFDIKTRGMKQPYK